MHELTPEEQNFLFQKIVLDDHGEMALYFANIMELCVKGPQGLSSEELRNVMRRTAEMFNTLMKIQWDLHDRTTNN